MNNKLAKYLRLAISFFLALAVMMTGFLGLFPTQSALAALESVNDTTFEAVVLKSSVPVLVNFCAAWAGPCKMLAPILEGVSNDYGDKVKVVYLNIDDSPENSRRYNVKSVPTLLVFNKGEKTNQKAGLTSRENIIKLLGI